MARDLIILCGREDSIPPHRIPRGLRRVKAIATCEFCTDNVLVNSGNLAEQRSKGFNPVLCCLGCYARGEHVKAGYTGGQL